MSERYSEITIASPVHGMNSMSSDCFVAADGYTIVRSADRLDVLIHNERTQAQRVIPWSQVRNAVPAEKQVIEPDSLVDLGGDEPITALATPAAKKRSGWPKGKPRTPKTTEDADG